MSIIKSPTMILGEVPPYPIDQSIRFDDAAEHFMYSPTPSSSKSFTTTATISMWIKLGNIGQHYLMGAFYGSNARYDYFQIDANNKLKGQGRSGGASTSTGSGATKWITSQVFRDPSAWYHLVFVYDTTNAVQSERFRLYVNGERVTEFDTNPSYGASELVYWFGKSSYTTLGAYFNQTGYADYFYWDGYMAEMHGVDGTALNADSFGTFNSSGIWTPKEYTGSHGTDGFYIKGANASNLGVNSADNGNNFTLNAISSHDQVLDSPTNNFAVFNTVMTEDADFEFLEGNLKVDMNTNKSWYVGAGASIGLSSGKWYWESYWNSGDIYTIWGILDTEQLHYLAGSSGSTTIYNQNFNGIQPNTSGTNDQYRQGASVIASGQAGAPGGIWQFALDMDNKKMWLGYNGTFTGSGDPSNGLNETWSSTYIASSSYTPVVQGYQISAHSILTFNFGQDSTFGGVTTAGGYSDSAGIGNFKFSVPSGYKALCTKNLGG